MFTIREFDKSEQDYTDAVAIHNAVLPDDQSTVAGWQYGHKAQNPKFRYQMFVAEADGKAVAYGGYAEPSWSYRPGKYFLNVVVHPASTNQGIGTLLYEHTLDVLAGGKLPPTMLVAKAREDHAASLRFLQKHGFQSVMRFPTSRLDVARFDAARFAATVTSVKASGIEILSVVELATVDPDYQHKIYELDWQCTLDEPMSDIPTKPTFEEYSKFVFDHPRFISEAYFIAVDNGDYVGLSELSRDLAQPDRLNTGFTAVARSHRRRGIATALKVCAIAYAQQHGYVSIKTDNEEHNPMYAINLDLGFVPQPAWLDFQKIIAE